MSNLTPFDHELIIMIQSVTGNEVTHSINGEINVLKTNVSGIEAAKIMALEPAVKGRLSDRFISFYVEDSVCRIAFKVSDEDLPQQINYELTEPQIDLGFDYVSVDGLEKIKAVKLSIESLPIVVAFTGGGSVTIPTKDHHDALLYQFPNQDGYYTDLVDGDFVINSEGLFTVESESMFNRNYKEA